jgi:muramoyltetrapeptide carboxypeptidase
VNSQILRKPRPLRPGDVLRVVAPAAPFNAQGLEAGLSLLRSWGYEPRVRADIGERRNYLAGTPERRAAEWMEAWEDEEAAAVLSVRGGYGVTTMLPLLDRDRLLAAPPKLVVGCSDLCAMLNWLVSSLSVPCIHGPMVEALGRGDDPAGAERLRKLLESKEKAPELHSVLPDAYAWCGAPGIARGRAVGGSLSLLAATCGTPFQPRTEGAVLFLEDIGERPYRVDRMLTQLQQCGMLDGIAGLVCGDFVNCDEPGGAISWRAAVDRIFRRLPVPLLLGIPFGHGNPNLAIPLGTQVEMDAGAGVLRFREAPVD